MLKKIGPDASSELPAEGCSSTVMSPLAIDSFFAQIRDEDHSTVKAAQEVLAPDVEPGQHNESEDGLDVTDTGYTDDAGQADDWEGK